MTFSPSLLPFSSKRMPRESFCTGRTRKRKTSKTTAWGTAITSSSFPASTRNGSRVQQKVPRTNPAIKDGQASLNAKICDAMNTRSFFVDKGKCPMLHKGLSTLKLTLRVKSRTFNSNEKRTPELMDLRFKILHLQRVLSGWGGLEFEDGSPIPFSKEMIKELWEVNPNLMGIIYSCVSSELSFVKAAEEKNSVTGADA